MNSIRLLHDTIKKDALQRGLDEIKGYMFFGLKREALQVRMELEDTYYDDPRMQNAPAAVLEVEQWIVRVNAALDAGRWEEICVLRAELDPPTRTARVFA